MLQFKCFFQFALVLIMAISQAVSAYPGTSAHVTQGGMTDLTPEGTQPGLNFELEPPNNCSTCHKALSTATPDFNYLPSSTWEGSMMANATRDPLFWAALDIANNDVPGIGDFCLRCHTPSGWYGGRVAKDGAGSIVDGTDGCLLLGDMTTEDNMDSDYSGVSCHLCHRLDPTGPDGETAAIGSGILWVDDEDCDQGFGPCRKGPYDYPDNHPNEAPHAWSRSTHILSAGFCGACHDISSPVLTGNTPLVTQLVDGVSTGRAMPLERTYTEWILSDFGAELFNDGGGERGDNGLLVTPVNNSCQGCHMPLLDQDDALVCRFTDPGSRTDAGRSHLIAGGSSWMPQVLKALYGDDLNRNEAFDAATAAALNMLQNNSAEISLSDAGSTIMMGSVNVRITNLTGHKLPTGYPEGRRMWLNIQASDADGALVFESGAYDLATAILTEDPQAKVYEILQGIWNSTDNECVTEQNGNKVFHFVLNNCIAKDNRIPPLGFKGATNPEVAPVGITYPFEDDRPNVLVNYDETPYQFAIPVGAVLPITVTAALKYQSVSKEYIDFLADESSAQGIPSENQMCNRTSDVGPGDQSRSQFMQQIWNDNGKSAPVDMVTTSLEVNPQ